MMDTIDRKFLVTTMRKCGIPGEPFETVNRDGVTDCVNIKFYQFAQAALFFTMLGQLAEDSEKIQDFATSASLEFAPREFGVHFKGWTLT